MPSAIHIATANDAAREASWQRFCSQAHIVYGEHNQLEMKLLQLAHDHGFTHGQEYMLPVAEEMLAVAQRIAEKVTS